MKNSFLTLMVFLGILSASTSRADPSDQRALFKSFSALQRMVQLYRQQGGTHPASLLGLGNTQQNPEPIPPEVEAQALQLKQITQDDCQIIMPPEQVLSVGQNDMQSSVSVFHFEMSGTACPIYVAMDVKAQQVDNKINADFLWEYKAISDEFKKQSDISEVHQQGKIYVEVTPGQTSQQLVMNVKIGGTGVSQAFGGFNVEHAMDSDMTFNFPLDIKASAVTTHTFQFKQDNIQLKRESLISGIFNISEKYSNNGQAIDLKTYSQLAQGIQFIGIGEKGDLSKLPPLSCELSLADAGSGAPVSSLKACMKDANSTAIFNQDFYQLNLHYTENWVEGKLTQMMTDQSEVLTGLYEEKSDFKKEAFGLTMHLNCQPVASCP